MTRNKELSTCEAGTAKEEDEEDELLLLLLEEEEEEEGCRVLILGG